MQYEKVALILFLFYIGYWLCVVLLGNVFSEQEVKQGLSYERSTTVATCKKHEDCRKDQFCCNLGFCSVPATPFKWFG